MAIPEINRDISEQATHIHEHSKKIWNGEPDAPDWEKFNENGWKFNPGQGFVKVSSNLRYRVTRVSARGLLMDKTENNSELRAVYVDTNPARCVSLSGGSELVELEMAEIFNELHSLNQAIHIFLDQLANPSLADLY